MKALELFAGIGGIALAAEWAGIETVAFCERDPFCQKVLKKHWLNVPVFDDIRTLNKQALIDGGVDVGSIELISGGFPCQPYSIAGERKGSDDDRALWKEMFRVIEEIRPTWVVGENVANFVNMGIDDALLNLENIGYRTQSFIIPAVAVGAAHRRDRVFMVANTDSEHEKWIGKEKIQGESGIQREFSDGGTEDWVRRSAVYEPKLCRNHNGIPDQMDRNQSLGNAVVPQQIFPILKGIKDIQDRRFVEI